MKKIKSLLLTLVMLFSIISPLSISAQETELTTDEAALNIINGLKTLASTSASYNGQLTMDTPDGEFTGELSGHLQLIISPALEFGFDMLLTYASESESESLDVQAYLVGDRVYYYYDDSASDVDGVWEETAAAETLGIDPSQAVMVYQMLISMFEGSYRGIYLPSQVHALVSEKTVIEEAADGYTITINSFETEEEWFDFFEALEELEGELVSETEEVASGVGLESAAGELDELQETAMVLSENLTYTIVFEVDKDYILNSIRIVSEATNPQGMESQEIEVEIESYMFDFIIEFDELNALKEIKLPQEVMQTATP